MCKLYGAVEKGSQNCMPCKTSTPKQPRMRLLDSFASGCSCIRPLLLARKLSLMHPPIHCTRYQDCNSVVPFGHNGCLSRDWQCTIFPLLRQERTQRAFLAILLLGYRTDCSQYYVPTFWSHPRIADVLQLCSSLLTNSLCCQYSRYSVESPYLSTEGKFGQSWLPGLCKDTIQEPCRNR